MGLSYEKRFIIQSRSKEHDEQSKSLVILDEQNGELNFLAETNERISWKSSEIFIFLDCVDEEAFW